MKIIEGPEVITGFWTINKSVDMQSAISDKPNSFFLYYCYSVDVGCSCAASGDDCEV
jgi:hypothetical protein